MRRALVIAAVALVAALATVATAGTVTALAPTAAARNPVVLMHGIGANASSMDHVVKWINAAYPDIYVKNVEIGDGYATPGVGAPQWEARTDCSGPCDRNVYGTL